MAKAEATCLAVHNVVETVYKNNNRKTRMRISRRIQIRTSEKYVDFAHYYSTMLTDLFHAIGYSVSPGSRCFHQSMGWFLSC